MVARIGHRGASPEGANSSYVLADRGVVVDPGPPGDDAWRRLRAGLEEAGVGVGAVEHVVVTHWHMDHAGLAPRLGEAADATVHMHENDAPLVGEYGAAREARVQRDARRLLAWGAPREVIDAVADADDPSPVPEEYPVAPRADGDRVAGLELLHTPGHTGGHVSVLAPGGARGSADLFLGDLVLPAYTPNVGGSDTRMADPLTAYLRSLSRVERRLRPPPGPTPRPGHGASLSLAGRIGAIRRHHRDRIREIDAVFEARERLTPWQAATELFGEMEGIHAKMGAGEAAAHLAFMERRGVVEQFGSSPDQYVRCRDVDLTAALDLSVGE